MKKEHFAFFMPGLYDGGAERIMLNLAQGITARGYRVDLILARAEGAYMADIPRAVRVIDLKSQRVLSSIPALAQYLRQEHPMAVLSILHANIPVLWAKRLAGYRGRVIVSEHNTLSLVAGGTADLRWRIFPLLAKWIYPLADKVIAVSNGVADDLAITARLPRENIQVIYNPIVTPDLVKKSKATFEHPWFRTGEPPVVLAIGRLTHQKAFDTLIHVFYQVLKIMSARLLILGEGEDRRMLEQLVSRLGMKQDVFLPGFVSNPYPYLARAAMFVLSSRWEGLPTVLVEAMSLGIPVVSTDCPSGPREILDNGHYGRLVAIGDNNALVQAVLAGLNSEVPCPPRESWQPFELETVVNQYIEVLLGA